MPDVIPYVFLPLKEPLIVCEDLSSLFDMPHLSSNFSKYVLWFGTVCGVPQCCRRGSWVGIRV